MPGERLWHHRRMPVYQPSHFRADADAAAALVDAAPFATLLTPAHDPWVTHLPLVRVAAGAAGAQAAAPIGLLEGHVARANPHWNRWREQPGCVALFHGPSSYVSPSLYGTSAAVPTWNYIVVHVHGTIGIVDDPAATEPILKRLIARFEPAYAAQWDDLDAGYKDRMLAAIVGLRITVQHVDAKFKLSQNRPADDRERVGSAFAAGTPAQADLAGWMRRLGIAAG
jgi:transcriptional regulator